MNFQNLLSDRLGSAPDKPKFRFPKVITQPFLTTMGCVALLAGVYYAFIGAPRYVSETRFAIHNQQPTMPTTSLLLAGISGTTTGVADIIAVQDQVQSQEMMMALDKQFHLRESYSQLRPDLFHWLPPGASDDSFLQFYRHMVQIKLDREADIVEVDVNSFDKDSAQKIATVILQRIENFVDGMTSRVRSESLRSAQHDLSVAQHDADVSRAGVSNYRGGTSSVDPKIGGGLILTGQTNLETVALPQAEADLASALTYSKPESAMVKQLQAKVDSIKTQVAKFRAQQGVGGQGKQVTGYETLLVQRDNAERTLAAAQAAFDAARSIAEQQEKYVVRVVNPSHPDHPTEPKRFWDFLMVMVFALSAYAIVSLTIAGIRDHRGI